MKDNLKKYLPEIIFTLLFLITYLPHFLYCWVPQLLDDSFAYLLIAKDFYDNQIPLNGHTMDLPYGYGFFISTVFKLGGSLRTVSLIQTLVFGLSFLYLINTLKAIGKSVGLISAILLWLYCSNSQSLLWNSLIYNESFYISSLVLTTVFIIKIYLNKNIKDIYFIAFSFLIAIYLRTNGIYLLFIPAVLLVFFYVNDKAKIKHVFFAYVIVLLINSTTNYIVKDYFAPSEIKRHISKLKGEVEFYDNAELMKDRKLYKFSDYPTSYIFEQTFELFTHIRNTQFGNHFYYRMHNQAKDFFPNKVLDKIIYLHSVVKYTYNGKETNESLRDFVITNIDYNQLNLNQIIENTDMSIKPRNIWVLSNHLVELGMFVYRNSIVLIVFYLLLFYTVYLFFKNKFKVNSIYFLIIFLSLVHLLSLTLFSISVVSDNALPRYAYVSEFIVYVVLILGFKNLNIIK